MTVQQEQEVPAIAATAGEMRARKRTWWLGLVVALVFSMVTPWLFYWPVFQGEYLGGAGTTKVTVTASGAGMHVEISGDASGTRKVSEYEAKRAWYTLRFGTGLDQQAIVYHPGGHYELVTGERVIALVRQTWLIRLAASYPYVVVLAMMAIMVGYLIFVVGEKAKAEPEVIHPVWLAYFGALFGSALILFGAGERGMFGFNGEPRTSVGHAILDAALFLLDIGTEFGTLLGLLAFVVLTQWFAYGFAGLSGAATRPRFIALVLKWVGLLSAKALISASAIVLSIETVGSHFYWVNTESHSLAANILTSAMLLFLGMCIFCMIPLRRIKGRPARAIVRRVHRWMRRRMRKKPNDVIARMQKRAMRRWPWSYWQPAYPSIPCSCQGACECVCRRGEVTTCRLSRPSTGGNGAASTKSPLSSSFGEAAERGATPGSRR